MTKNQLTEIVAAIVLDAPPAETLEQAQALVRRAMFVVVAHPDYDPERDHLFCWIDNEKATLDVQMFATRAELLAYSDATTGVRLEP